MWGPFFFVVVVKMLHQQICKASRYILFSLCPQSALIPSLPSAVCNMQCWWCSGVLVGSHSCFSSEWTRSACDTFASASSSPHNGGVGLKDYKKKRAPVLGKLLIRYSPVIRVLLPTICSHLLPASLFPCSWKAAAEFVLKYFHINKVKQSIICIWRRLRWENR